MNSPDPYATLRMSDRDLLAECEVHTYRASGPGGQKRNKVESAVRIRHLPTGVTAIAEESRSQLENRPLALRRLREAIAIRVRSSIDLADFQPPTEFRAALSAGGRIRVTAKNPNYPIAVATVLDVFNVCSGRVSDAGKALGLSTHHLTQFLAEHPRVWQEANRIRAQHGQQPLRISASSRK
jgi:hypothetical protein